ncbi:MAG: hypothetical protein JWQ29_1890, partial [Phenylobacterium sp.]|nr:hypothetical protein [Phenylobacterium sp.]
MDWRAFCLERADDCERRSDASTDPKRKLEWRQMAEDWRTAA